MNPREARSRNLFRVEALSTFSEVATVARHARDPDDHPLGAPRDVTLEESETEAIFPMAKLNICRESAPDLTLVVMSGHDSLA